MKPLLAVDWGTSSLRGALIAPDGQVMEARSFARGILTVAPGEFPAVFESCFGTLMAPGTPCFISGMAGSQQGWLEAPYCPCPAGLGDLAARLAWVEPGRIAIVPGVCTDHDGIPDVMRGEETQIFGALQMLGLHSATLVLPGTHSKWVTADQNRITGFSTWMTGEVYALLRNQSILARTLPATEGELDETAFDDGAGRSLRGEPLLHTAFSTRTLALFKRRQPEALPSYLSGLVIGEELRSQHLSRESRIVVIGAEALSRRYQRVLGLLGVTCTVIGSEATWMGLRGIAQAVKAA
jgi:2-dehydro-3-deoxygalactonokinase